MKMSTTISNSDFKDYIQNRYYYVDKSLLIEELFSKGDEATLLPRPRRFGKTLNLSMLQYYFNIREDNRGLFIGLKIEKSKIFEEYANKYPVVSLTFKNVNGIDWEEDYMKLVTEIRREYREHKYLLESDKLDYLDKEYFKQVYEGSDKIDYSMSTFELSRLLYEHYGKKVIVLLDEYDTPVNKIIDDNHYKYIINFLKNLIGSTFKGNKYLFKGVITGILRIAKESLFSGANNIMVRTILDNDFSDKFGFTEEEVIKISDYYDMGNKIDSIREWYNGYTFGNNTIYNPFSIINFTIKRVLESYWVNSGNSSLIEKLMLNSEKSVIEKLENLIKGNSIEEYIEESIVFSELNDSKNLWSLLLFSGYLKSTEGDLGKYTLSIPNKELKKLYNKIMEKYFTELAPELLYIMDNIAKSILNDNIDNFRKELENLLLSNISSYDISKSKEEVYHIITLFSLLKLEYKNNYEVKSNIESGNGRYDISIIPKAINKIGYIIELKVTKDEKDLKSKSEEAIKQIEKNKYYIELVKKGIKNIKLLGIAFKGKNVFITEKIFKN